LNDLAAVRAEGGLLAYPQQDKEAKDLHHPAEKMQGSKEI
jgi:hypothetical protein